LHKTDTCCVIPSGAGGLVKKVSSEQPLCNGVAGTAKLPLLLWLSTLSPHMVEAELESIF
jgi:hypothetical protein